MAMLVLLLGCTALPNRAAGAPDHAATVDALLPTAEPAEPTVAPTMADPTTAPTDPPPPPTYTPRPPPTYTPRPAPTPESDGERTVAIPFQAELLDGSKITLSDTFGSPTLLAFWAHW